MTPKRKPNAPEQLDLFQEERCPVSWVMRRWRKSRPTIHRMIEHGVIAAFRLHPTANWEVLKRSVLELEARLAEGVGSLDEYHESSPITSKKAAK